MMTPEQVHDYRKFWLTNSGYLNYMLDSAGGNDYKLTGIALVEIALNLHEIAQQLAEMNNYVPESFQSIEVDDE